MKRKLILRHKDLKNISTLPFDFDSPLHGIKDELSPKVKIRGNEAKIEAYYWSEYYGLVKEKVVITITSERVTNVKQVGIEVLFPYYCGILY